MFAPVVPDVLRAKVTIFIDLFVKSHALERSSAELRDSDARTRSVLEGVADAIVTVTDEGLIESFNRAACELFGYSEHEAIGRPFATMVGATDPTERPVESIVRRKDGSTFPVELNVSDVQLGAGTIDVACLRDISQVRAYTRMLQHQARYFDLSHDLVCAAGFDGYIPRCATHAWSCSAPQAIAPTTRSRRRLLTAG